MRQNFKNIITYKFCKYAYIKIKSFFNEIFLKIWKLNNKAIKYILKFLQK